MIASGMISRIKIYLVNHAACDHAYPVFILANWASWVPLNRKHYIPKLAQESVFGRVQSAANRLKKRGQY